MKGGDAPVVRDVVLIGGGHSHVAVLKRFGMDPVPGAKLTLICRDIHTPYSGMLPGYIAGHYDFDQTHIDLGPLSRFAGARFYNDEVTSVDVREQLVYCKDRPPVPYDLLSINVGSSPRRGDVPGAEGNVVPVKPINNFIARWEALRDRVLERTDPMRIAVVGAGAGGVEVLLSIQFALQRLLAERGRDADHLDYHLFSESDTILPTHNSRVQDRFMRVLAERGVNVHAGEAVVQVAPGRLSTESGNSIQVDETLWVTAAGAAPWLEKSALALDHDGFVLVADTLQSVSHPEVFAAGDIASMVNHPRPKSGVFAVRQGPPLARNLRRLLLNKEPRPFNPQLRFLSLISTGNKYAVASHGKRAISGRLMWRWKDWIDRRFMKKYNVLPDMKDDDAVDLPKGIADREEIKELSAIAMRCGGCGAKIGATTLSHALDTLEPVARDDVVIGLHEPDDAAVVEVPPGKVMVHTVDSFRAMIDDPYMFGRIAANHSLGDIYAMGGDPQTVLAIATVPFGLEDKVEETLTQMMAGAARELAAANAALVGGHSAEGAELTLGFAVNGLVDRERVMRKAGLAPGDKLILTKPLGTGTLFAADMRHKAKGRWIAAALDTMVQSNRDGARCLLDYGARACTDVTGFGLLGHLVEMARPSDVDITLALNAVPLLDGAEETAAAGILSSLQPQNVRLRRAIANLDAAGQDPRFPLIFDPQTAGGLLAGVPKDRAEACIAELHRLGYTQSAVIGEVLPRGNQPEPITVRV